MYIFNRLFTFGLKNIPLTKNFKMKKIDTTTTYSQYHDFTMARYDYSLMEMRLLLDILFLTDKYIKGGNTFTLDMGSIYKEGDDIKMRIPYEVILANTGDAGKGGSKNNLAAKEAMDSFGKKTISFYDSDDQWREVFLFQEMEKKAGEAAITVTLTPKSLEVFKKLSNHYTTVDMKNMMKMRSKYTIRMHQINEGLIRPITFKISTLREMFMLEGKYKNNNDFIRKVLDTAQDELNDLGLNSFDYQKSYDSQKHNESRKGKPALTKITIIPTYKDTMDEITVRRMVKEHGLTYIFTDDELTELLKFGFRPNEIEANAPDIYNFCRIYNLLTEIGRLEKESMKKENPKGWVISRMRQMLEISQG